VDVCGGWWEAFVERTIQGGKRKTFCPFLLFLLLLLLLLVGCLLPSLLVVVVVVAVILLMLCIYVEFIDLF